MTLRICSRGHAKNSGLINFCVLGPRTSTLEQVLKAQSVQHKPQTAGSFSLMSADFRLLQELQVEVLEATRVVFKRTLSGDQVWVSKGTSAMSSQFLPKIGLHSKGTNKQKPTLLLLPVFGPGRKSQATAIKSNHFSHLGPAKRVPFFKDCPRPYQLTQLASNKG